MRFVLVKVRDVMGLTGVIGFSTNPILLYGRNLAGKTNLINLIRYCFVFGKSRKSYSEEKRLQPRITTFVPGGRKAARSSKTNSPSDLSLWTSCSKPRRMSRVSGQLE